MSETMKSIYAGAAIAIGGVIFLSCDSRYMGAFLFSLGLMAVCIFGFNLYTGKVSNPEYLKNIPALVKILLLNAVGAIIVALLMKTNGNMVAAAKTVAAAKVDKSFLRVLTDSILCGFFISFAVKGYSKAEGTGKYMMIIMSVMGFILCGAEHVIADIFYFMAATNTPFFKTIGFLLIATVGNAIGGIVCSIIKTK